MQHRNLCMPLLQEFQVSLEFTIRLSIDPKTATYALIALTGSGRALWKMSSSSAGTSVAHWLGGNICVMLVRTILPAAIKLLNLRTNYENKN